MDLWNAWQWVEYVRSLSTRARNLTGHDLEEAERMLVLAMLWVLPMSSVEDLAGLRYLSKSKIEKLKVALIAESYAGIKVMGHALGEPQRHFLLPRGVRQARAYWQVAEEWQTRDDTLKVLHGCLPIVEVVNRVLPRFWRTQAVRTPTVVAVGPRDDPHFVTIDDNVRLSRLIWVRAEGRSIHALAEYRSADGCRFWIPVVWQGYVCSADDRVETLADLYTGFRTEPSGWYGEPAAPMGAIFLAPDWLSGIHVRMTVANGIPKAVVTAHDEVVEQLTPVSPVGYLYPPVEKPNVREVGTPFGDWVSEASIPAVSGEEHYSAFREIEISSGISPSHLGGSIGRPRGDARVLVNTMKEAGLVRETKVVPVEVETPALKNRNRRAELDIDERRVRLPLRLPQRGGTGEMTEFEIECGADREGVVQAGHVEVVVRTLVRKHPVEIERLNVPVRITQSHARLEIEVGGWPIAVRLPFAHAGPYKDTNLYLTSEGEILAARMDRIHVNVLRDRFGEYRTARGRIRKASHDSRAHRFQAQYLKKGGNRRLIAIDRRWFATSGLRMVINFPGDTQLAPDLWLIIPIGNGRGLLVPVEYEQTAVADNAVRNKLRPHFVVRELNAPFPLLMACKRGAVPVFQARGQGLSMLVASFQDALADQWVMPGQVAGAAQQVVGAEHLAGMEGWRGELLQVLNLQL